MSHHQNVSFVQRKSSTGKNSPYSKPTSILLGRLEDQDRSVMVVLLRPLPAYLVLTDGVDGKPLAELHVAGTCIFLYKRNQ